MLGVKIGGFWGFGVGFAFFGGSWCRGFGIYLQHHKRLSAALQGLKPRDGTKLHAKTLYKPLQHFQRGPCLAL